MSGKIIKEKREHLGYSQSQLAEISGVNFRTLQDYEQGRKPIWSVKGDVLYKLSTTLGCSIEELLLETESESEEINLSQVYRMKRYAKYFDDYFNRESEEIHTPFDDVFKTMSVDCPQFFIPLINLVFNEHYLLTDAIYNRNNEHHVSHSDGASKKIISDSNILILNHDGNKKSYQIECQSRTDNTIIVRLMEYATSIAMEDYVQTDDTITINYPNSALLYLRHNSRTPDKMKFEINTPAGKIAWDVPIIKSQNYDIDQIFENDLFVLIPYYLLTYEKDLDMINKDSDRINKLKSEYLAIFNRLEKLIESGRISTYEYLQIKMLSEQICKYLTSGYKEIKKEMTSIMGGKVLEYEAKTIYKRGRNEGRNEGAIERSEQVFVNMITRGFSYEDAVAISEISESRAKELMVDIK